MDSKKPVAPVMRVCGVIMVILSTLMMVGAMMITSLGPLWGGLTGLAMSLLFILGGLAISWFLKSKGWN